MAENGVELATAYVSLTVSLQGQQKVIEAQLAKPIEAAVQKAAVQSQKAIDTSLAKAAANGRKQIETQLSRVKAPVLLDTRAAEANAKAAREHLERAMANTKLTVGDRIGTDVEKGATRATRALSRIGNGESANTAVSIISQLTSGLTGVDTQAIQVAGSLADVGSSIGPQAAVVIGVGLLAGAMALAAHQAEEVARRHIDAAAATELLAKSAGLAKTEVSQLGNALVSPGKFALDNQKAIASLRAQTDPAVQKAIIQNIGFDLIQAGNSYKDARAAVQRLADAAGITIPANIDINSFDSQVEAAAARAKGIADKVTKLGGQDSAFDTGDLPFGLAQSSEAKGVTKDIENLATQLASIYQTDGPEAYARAAGEAEKALGGQDRTIRRLARATLEQTQIQGLNTSETENAGDALRQLSSADSEADATFKRTGRSLLDRADAMKGGATAANLADAASREAGRSATELAKAEEKVVVSSEALTNALADQRNKLSALTLDYQVGQAAKAAYANSIDAQTVAGGQLAAGLSAGAALNSLRKGLFGEADAAGKAASKSELAAKAVQHLNDNLKLTDPAASMAAMRLGAMAAGADGFRKSISDSTGLDDQLTSAVDLGEAFTTLRHQARRLPAEFDRNKAALGRYLPEQNTALRAVTQLGTATRDYLATLIQTGEGTATVRSEAGRLRDEYSAQLRAVGLTEEQVQKYIRTLGLTPDQVETAIKVSGTEEARFKVNALLQLLDGKIPAEVATKVAASIGSGDVDGAVRQLQAYAASNPVRIEVKPEIADADKLTLPKVLDPMKAAFGGYSESDTKGVQAVLALGQQYTTYLAGIASNAPEAIAQAAAFRDELLKTLQDFGLTKDEADAYIRTIGLADDQVTTAVVLSGAESAMTQLELLRTFMTNADGTGIPDEVNSEVSLLIADGKFNEARDVLANFRKEQEKQEIHLKAVVDIVNAGQVGIMGIKDSTILGRAGGGPQAAGEPGIVGERGPELWWPDAAGTVISNEATQAIIGGGEKAQRGGRGGARIGTVNQYGLRPDQGGVALMLELKRIERENEG